MRDASLEVVFRACVHGAGRLVEQRDRGLQNDRPRQRNGLTLAARQAFAAFADDEIVARGMLTDEIIDTGDLGRTQDGGIVDMGGAHDDVVADRTVKQKKELIYLA